jgi:hypothetical protein
VIGTAVGAWWFTRQRGDFSSEDTIERGTVIFHNTPTPTPLSGEGVF